MTTQYHLISPRSPPFFEKIYCRKDILEGKKELRLDGIDGVFILHDLYSIKETKEIKQKVEGMIKGRNEIKDEN